MNIQIFGKSKCFAGDICRALRASEKAPGAEEVKSLAYASDKEEKLLENQRLIRTPVVRNGKKATVGYAPETWSEWE